MDFVVQVEPGRSLIDFVALWQELEELLDSRVDLVSEGGISPHMRERTLSEAVDL